MRCDAMLLLDEKKEELKFASHSNQAAGRTKDVCSKARSNERRKGLNEGVCR